MEAFYIFHLKNKNIVTNSEIHPPVQKNYISHIYDHHDQHPKNDLALLVIYGSVTYTIITINTSKPTLLYW